MATVATISVPADSFPLGTVFADFPNVSVELERIVPTEHALIPYAWVSGADEDTIERIESAFRDHPDVHGVSMIDEVSGDFLQRIEWMPEYDGILRAIHDADVSLLEGVGAGDEWEFKIRSTERGGIATFQQACRDLDIPVTVQSVHQLSCRDREAVLDLTDPQREALVLAYERGYFDTPRRATLGEIGRELGITRQSLASRLRRGERRLIAGTLVGP